MRVCATVVVCLACVAALFGSAAAASQQLRGMAAAVKRSAAAAARSGERGTVAASSKVIDTTLGPVIGSVVSTSAGDAAQWLGIPYAATTGEENRFMPPQPRAHWTEPLEATQWPAGCIQVGDDPDVPKDQSEDCLTVNVWAPADSTASSSLPTMVFIFGGAFVEGSNRGPFSMYDSSYIVADQPVVVATCNYRLGPYGWMVTDEGVAGNMGLLDQRSCMEWVRDNIAKFGGDPSQVTIWGESAGAMSVGLHLISPGSAGLFSKAIMESNPAGFKYRDTKDQAYYGDKACSEMDCKPLLGKCNVTCMQHKTTSEVSAAWAKAAKDYVVMGEANWGNWLELALDATPTVDGDIVPTTVQQALLKGSFAKDVDVLLGTNNNEGTTFAYALLNSTLSEIEYWAMMKAIYGSHADAVMDAYKNFTNVPSGDYRDVVSRIITDGFFRCPSERFASAIRAHGSSAYVYVFNHPNFSGRHLFDLFDVPIQCYNKTCHMVELPFVFHFLSYPSLNYQMTAVEESLSQSMVEYWTSFAISGKPTSSHAGFAWPEWDAATRENIMLQDTFATSNSVDLCTFWDEQGYNF